MDTNHASSAWQPRKTVVKKPRKLRGYARIALCLPSVGELWFMVHNSDQVESNRERLENFLVGFEILKFDFKAAEEFGKLCSVLRKTGREIKQIDVQIAAIARVHNLIILTADKHFTYIPGIKVDNWLSYLSA